MYRPKSEHCAMICLANWSVAMRNTLLALVLLSGTVCAQEIAIKEFVLGGDLRAEAAKGGMTCGPSPIKGSAAEWCHPPYAQEQRSDAVRTIANASTRSVFLLGFDNKLGSIRWTFAQSSFALVRDAFREKYPSLKCVDSVVQNRAGANFEQTECVYRSATATLTIKRRGSDLTEGSIDATSQEHERLWEADHKKRTGEAKKDI